MADENYVDGAPAGADGWREVWLADRRYRPQPSRHEWLLRIVRRLFRRAAEPDTERQKNFLQGFAMGADVARAVRGLPVVAGSASAPPAGVAVVAPSTPERLQAEAQDRALAEGKTLSREEQARRHFRLAKTPIT